MSRFISLFVVTLACLLIATPADARAGMPRIEVSAPRIKLSDVVATEAAKLVDVDLGAAPAPGGSRIIVRRTIQDALARAGVTGIGRLPRAVRVVRKMDTLTRDRLIRLARGAIAKQKLRRGITLRKLRPARAMTVAAGWDEVSVRLPKPPRRRGHWSTTAMLTFSAAGTPLARLALPVSFDISAEGAKPDVSKGAPLILVVRRGLVEIKVQAIAKTSADIGEILSVTLRPSGRNLRAKLLAGGRALAMGAGR